MIGERTYGIMLVLQPHQSCREITADDYLEGIPLIHNAGEILTYSQNWQYQETQRMKQQSQKPTSNSVY